MFDNSIITKYLLLLLINWYSIKNIEIWSHELSWMRYQHWHVRTYCENCSSEQGITKLISDYFHRGYPYGAIVGLLSAAGVQIICKNFKAPFEIFRFKTKETNC